MPSRSSRASTKASMGLRTQRVFFTGGSGGSVGAVNAQCDAATEGRSPAGAATTAVSAARKQALMAEKILTLQDKQPQRCRRRGEEGNLILFRWKAAEASRLQDVPRPDRPCEQASKTFAWRAFFRVHVTLRRQPLQP